MGQGHAFFATRHNDLLHTCGVVADRRDDRFGASPDTLAALAEASRRPGASASGKIAIVQHRAIATYQVDATGDVTPAFCGNATGAAIMLVQSMRAQRFVLTSGGAGDRYEVIGSCAGRRVAQTWIVPEASIEERMWRGRRVATLNTLNPYAIIIGALPEGVTSETARAELLGGVSTAKLVVVAECGPVPLVEFYNASGRHGALPQTGLASLALAARAAPSFRAMFDGRRIAYTTRAGRAVHDVPTPAETGDGRLAISMPATFVDLSERVLDEAV